MKEYIVQFSGNSDNINILAEHCGFQELVRCKDCKYYRKDGDCWHEWDNAGRIYYQSIINEPNPDDYCSLGKREDK